MMAWRSRPRSPRRALAPLLAAAALCAAAPRRAAAQSDASAACAAALARVAEAAGHDGDPSALCFDTVQIYAAEGCPNPNDCFDNYPSGYTVTGVSTCTDACAAGARPRPLRQGCRARGRLCLRGRVFERRRGATAACRRAFITWALTHFRSRARPARPARQRGPRYTTPAPTTSSPTPSAGRRHFRHRRALRGQARRRRRRRRPLPRAWRPAPPREAGAPAARRPPRCI